VKDFFSNGCQFIEPGLVWLGLECVEDRIKCTKRFPNGLPFMIR
jgi:hypothetical protein